MRRTLAMHYDATIKYKFIISILGFNTSPNHVKYQQTIYIRVKNIMIDTKP